MMKKITTNYFDWLKYAIQTTGWTFLCLLCIGVNSQILDAQITGAATESNSDSSSAIIENRTEEPNKNTENINFFINSVKNELSQKKVIATSISQTSNIYNRHYQGKGTYLEKEEGNNKLLRLDMNYVSGKERFDLLYVSDGRKFWTSKNSGAGRVVSYIDLFMLHQQDYPSHQTYAEPNPTETNFAMANTQNPLCGMARFMDQVFRYFNFTYIEENGNPQTGEKWVRLKGTWKEETFPFRKEGSQEKIDWKHLSADIPDNIELVFGANDLFPYKIVYTRKQGKEDVPVSTIQFSEVSFSTRISSEQFRFDPPAEIIPLDKTPRYRLQQEEKP